MAVLMDKQLSQTDIECRLAFPTPSLWAFPMPEGETCVSFEATDTLENEWNFRLSIRGENSSYTKTVITGDWLKFVRDKSLKVGDKIVLMREEGVNGVTYSIRAERKIFNVWANV